VLAPPPGVGTPAARAGAPVRRHPLDLTLALVNVAREVGSSSLEVGREERREKTKKMLRAFLNYGLVAAVVVWAAVVGMMAYRLEDSPWRWAFVALVFAGGMTIAGIFKIRKYVDAMNKSSEEQRSKS